jgi:hypothetical protein
MSTQALATDQAVALPVEPAATTTLCMNCGATRVGEYCHECGQHHLSTLTIQGMVLEFLQRKLSLENGMLRTFIDLTVRPGAMIRAYVRGKRQTYTNPVGYLLISAGLTALALPLWEDRYTQSVAEGLDGGTATAMVQVSLWMERHGAATVLLLCLFFVPLLRVLFDEEIRTAESFVFAFFAFGHITLWNLLLIPFAMVFSEDPFAFVNNVGFFMLVGMLLYAAGGYFGTRFTTFLKILVAFGVAMLLFLGVTIVTVVFLMVWNQWQGGVALQ